MKRIFLILVTTLFLTALPGRAASLTFDPSAASVSPGDMITLDLIVGDLGGTLVGAFDVDISFDPTVLTLDAFTFGSFLGIVPIEADDFGLSGIVVPGLLNLNLTSFLSVSQLAALQNPPPSFPLATLDFTVGPLAAGTSTLVEIATVNAVSDETGFIPIPVTTLGAVTLTNPAAPPPPAAPQFSGSGMTLLLATGLLGFAGTLRSRFGSRGC